MVVILKWSSVLFWTTTKKLLQAASRDAATLVQKLRVSRRSFPRVLFIARWVGRLPCVAVRRPLSGDKKMKMYAAPVIDKL